VVAAVQQATAELLAEVGYDALSMEEVATRAGVHKTTVYRRWPTKAELVSTTVRELSERSVVVPDTGTLQGDLAAFSKAIVAYVNGPQTLAAARSLLAAAAGSEELASGLHRYWADRIHNATPIITRAIERGELAASVDPTLAIETAIGPIWVRLLLTGEPVTPELAEEVAATVAAGLAAQR
jgi:AcrR family transcriptional regulator